MDVSSIYSTAKAIHLAGMVAWFSGMFFLVRIFVNHAEAALLQQPDRQILTTYFSKMEWRVYKIIMNPAIVLTWSAGCTMLAIQPEWLHQPWMHTKLLLLVLLTGYHHYCQSHIKRLEKDDFSWSHKSYRLLNELPTIFLFGIIFLAVFKSQINWLYWCLGIAVFTALLYFSVKKSKLSSKNE